MAKGDDIVRRKKNKAHRKKLNAAAQPDSSSARVAAIIAAKKRRKSGLRRKCQGMCFSLPTPDDPFNDRNGKKDPATIVSKKIIRGKKDKDTGKTARDKINGNVNVGSSENGKTTKARMVDDDNLEKQACDRSDCPSKYLIMCLNEIENSLRNDGSNEDKPLFASSWGIKFWKCYSGGKDMLDTSRACSSVEQIAWIVCSAADTICRKDEEGLSYASPFLLFLVPSQDKAVKVRSVCKPLKVHGVHTVSIHPGAALDHQIQGLKNCEPEFLISTPERLLELISSEAIDVSGVSLLIVDGTEADQQNGYIDSIKAVTKSLSGNTRRLVFDCFPSTLRVPLLQAVLTGPVHRLSK